MSGEKRASSTERAAVGENQSSGGDSASPGAPIGAALREDSERGARLRQSWRESPERKRSIIAMISAAIVVVVAAVVAARIAYTTSSEVDRDVNTGVATAVTAGLLAYVAFFTVFLLYRNQQRRAWYDRAVVLQAHAELERAATEVTGGDDHLELETLWSLTQKRLDYYHALATGQSERSFNYGLAAAGVGFLVVIASAVASALGRSAAASVSAALVGLGGGGLAAYIGGTFMRLQENSARQLRAYFSQPLEFSRFLAAERLIDQLGSDQQGAARLAVIKAIADPGARAAETARPETGSE